MAVPLLVTFGVEISETGVHYCSGFYYTGPIAVHTLSNLPFANLVGGESNSSLGNGRLYLKSISFETSLLSQIAVVSPTVSRSSPPGVCRHYQIR